MTESALPDGPRADNPLSLLTRREVEILEMTALGLTNAEIGRRLNVTLHAVKFHLAGVYRKLGVVNRTEAVVRFLRAGGAPAAQ